MNELDTKILGHLAPFYLRRVYWHRSFSEYSGVQPRSEYSGCSGGQAVFWEIRSGDSAAPRCLTTMAHAPASPQSILCTTESLHLSPFQDPTSSTLHWPTVFLRLLQNPN